MTAGRRSITSRQLRGVLDSLLVPPSAHPAFIFAHPDDAVLCATRGLLAAQGGGLDVVVHAGRPPRGPAGAWDQCSGFITSSEAHRSRTVEHDRACDMLHLDSVRLSFVDSQYREPSRKHKSICDASREKWQSIAESARDSIWRFGVGVIVSHREDAHHPDHAQAARLAGAIGCQLGVPIVRVCDRPYVQCCPECSQDVDTVSKRATVALGVDEWKTKRELVAFYRSQHVPLAQAFGSSWNSRKRLGWECFAVDQATTDTSGVGVEAG